MTRRGRAAAATACALGCLGLVSGGWPDRARAAPAPATAVGFAVSALAAARVPAAAAAVPALASARAAAAVAAVPAVASARAAAAVPAAAPAPAPAAARTPADGVLARDLREEVRSLGVVVRDRRGREETRQIPVTIFRPRGDGPFPLVIMNHGRAVDERRPLQGRQRFEHLARYLVAKGFTVFVPTRVGYGQTYGGFDPEDSGRCNAPQIEPMSTAASDQVLATLAFARGLPFVDASRWVVMGQSVGGLAAVATVWRRPAGLVGGINFSGGTGGDPEHAPGEPCGASQIARLWHERAADAQVPMLWLYWQNDRYWGPENPKRWHEAWIEGGARAEFHSRPAVGSDGHAGLHTDMDHWVPLVERFLKGLGFTRPGTIERPPASGWAALDDVDRVPVRSPRRSGYSSFLDSRLPRAFAVSPTGGWGWASGDWALGRALGACQRRGESCRLYAVDREVVWVP